MSKCFIVLGMHRSATSLVAKGLSNEIYMGEKFGKPHKYNQWGEFENLDFVRLNNEILRYADGSWDNPPPEEKILSYPYKHKIETLIKNHEKDFWGWKDPRTTLTIKLYEPYLENPHYICSFRDPKEVAKSLQKRDGWDIERGLKLAKIYNKRLTEFLCQIQ